MQKLILRSMIVLVLGACASSHSKNEATALSLSPELTYDLSMLDRCEQPFWQSLYGRTVSEKTKKAEEVNVKNYFDGLSERPKACSLSQMMLSMRGTFGITQALRKNKSFKANAAQFRSVKNVLLNTPLSLSELLGTMALLDAMTKDVSLDKEALKAWSELKKDFLDHQDDILARTIKHDIQVMQGVIYRMELLDWDMSLDASTPEVPTRTEMETYAKYNKYEEILKIEGFKKTILDNQKCLANQSCYLCYLDIQSVKCAEDNLPEEEKYKKYNYSGFLAVISSKYQDGIVRIMNYIKKLH